MPGQMLREWKCIVRGPAAAVAALLLFITGLYALWNGLQWSGGIAKAADVALSNAQRDFDVMRANTIRFERSHPGTGAYLQDVAPAQRSIRGLNAMTVSIGGTVAVLPPRPLAHLSIGQSDLYPAFTSISLWNNRHDLFTEVDNDNPLNLVNGRFDAAFLILYVCPLFILALTYDVISGEREAGTLAWLASSPTGLGALVSRRLLLIGIVLLGPVATIAIAGTLTRHSNAETLTALACWLIIVAAYAAFWFGLAVLVNSRGWNSEANAIVLATVWLALVLILPALLNLAVIAVAPVPSRTAYVLALRDARNASERPDATTEVLLEEYFQQHPEMRSDADGYGSTTIPIYWLQMWSTARQMESVVNEYDLALKRQGELADKLRFLSPAVLTLDVLNELAGTSSGRYMRFREAAVDFQRQWHHLFAAPTFKGRRMTGDMYAGVPQFTMKDTDPGVLIVRTLTGAIVLLAAVAVMLAVAVRTMRRGLHLH
jgi:ABC-2 type transport system permease protein